jgi:DNA-binding response OmpR family regulator
MIKEKLVLLVDDEPATLKATAVGLLDRGFQVQGVDGADAAMTAIQTLKPSIIVSDLVMPGTNGFELFEKVKNHRECGSIPFIFLTAVDDYYAQKFGKQMGSAAYITKPVDFNELERVLLEKLGE